MKIILAGANGHLGRRLIEAIGSQHEIVAVVRSLSAAQLLIQLPCQVAIVAYSKHHQLTKAAQGCDLMINLTGIIKATRTNSYFQAHEETASALVAACQAAGVPRIIALGICGTSLSSSNACFRSRAAAEQVMCEGIPTTTILRVPMVLGEGDYASRALLKKSSRAFSLCFRSASLEQPVYAGDVIAALSRLLDVEAPGVLELAGPESLSRSSLIQRTAAVSRQGTVAVISIPLAVGLLMAYVLETLVSNPPVTRDMLGVLDHDDQTESDTAERLGISLTPLDKMLSLVG